MPEFFIIPKIESKRRRSSSFAVILTCYEEPARAQAQTQKRMESWKACILQAFGVFTEEVEKWKPQIVPPFFFISVDNRGKWRKCSSFPPDRIEDEEIVLHESHFRQLVKNNFFRRAGFAPKWRSTTPPAGLECRNARTKKNIKIVLIAKQKQLLQDCEGQISVITLYKPVYGTEPGGWEKVWTMDFQY